MIYAKNLEVQALNQYLSAMEQPFVVKGALMADAHMGYSLPIGSVVGTDNFVVPSWVGYDIGCGVCAVMTSFDKQDIIDHSQEIFDDIYDTIPMGFKHHQRQQEWFYDDIRRTDVANDIFLRNGLKQLGTLGGGNHFIEIGYDEDDQVWILVHSGSRGIGHAVATHYMKLASPDGKAKEGHYGFYADSVEGQDYLKDMKFCLMFAEENRYRILKNVILSMKSSCCAPLEVSYWSTLINRTHNHIDFKDGMYIHRKGATHAEKDMFGVIPGNMRDGSFIVRGKENPDSLYSSSHGAGRVLGRTQATKTLSMEKFKDSMQGITSAVTLNTLDESPEAYKNIFDVMENQKDLVEVINYIKPLINIKSMEKSRKR
jgi:tRNA-splicing ligase RtcB